MLSSEVLSKILVAEIPKLIITDIHWRCEDSNESSLLFYKIKEDQESESRFLKKIKESKFSWLIVNRSILGMPKNTTVIKEEKWLLVQKKIIDILYPMPNLKLIAITGTNGKTTTTDLVLQIGELIKEKGLSIGTLGVREYNHTILDFGLTSPNYMDLRKYLNIYGKNKKFCAVEASSHALIQDRFYDLTFDSAGWTSFSQDHLDYHVTMDEYFKAKCLLFSKLKIGAKMFVPSEQKNLLDKLQIVSKSCTSAPEINLELPLFFKTQFNKNNLEVAKAILESVYNVNIQIDYNKLIPPDGRFYIQGFNTNYIVVDFAHTPDALENICLAIKETFPNHKLKVLFGCGGDRDRFKRPKMAEVVAKFADEIYVTSDNPRSENPERIIADIVLGLKNKIYKVITDRPTAVRQAFSEMNTQEVLLLAGKGHENYILIDGVKHPYSDIEQVDLFIRRNKK